MNISKISDDYAVAPQILPDEVSAIAKQGFVAIICNRPDGEEPGQPALADIIAACSEAGLSFHHVPVSGMSIPDDAIAEHRRVIDQSDGPVLAYCRSGQRSLLIWQASA
jgi:sulfide:quinone oxidoreductase